jgi:hypothetical protein
MVGSRIPSTLIVSGTLLLVLYAAGWGALAWRALHPDPAADPTSAAAPGDARSIDYRVTDVEGNEHIMRADANDPAALLLEVSRRFGDGASMQRLEPREAAQARQREEVSPELWLGLLLILPLSLTWAGVRLKRRELDLLRVWQVMRPTLSVPLPTLLQRTGQSETTLKQNLLRLTERGWADLQYHPDTGRVFDGRLSAYSLTLAHCPQCNEPANARMLADLNNVPTCQACMNTYDATFLEAQKRDLVLKLVEESVRRSRERPVDADFSLARYALFALLFPPAALSYALTKAG